LCGAGAPSCLRQEADVGCFKVIPLIRGQFLSKGTERTHFPALSFAGLGVGILCLHNRASAACPYVVMCFSGATQEKTDLRDLRGEKTQGWSREALPTAAPRRFLHPKFGAHSLISRHDWPPDFMNKSPSRSPNSF